MKDKGTKRSLQLAVQIAAVSLAAESCDKGSQRSLDRYEEQLAHAAETLSLHRSLFTVLSNLAGHHIADILVDRLQRTPREYAEMILFRDHDVSVGNLGSTESFPIMLDVVLGLVDAVFGEIFSDVTGGALPQLSTVMPDKAAALFCPRCGSSLLPHSCPKLAPLPGTFTMRDLAVERQLSADSISTIKQYEDVDEALTIDEAASRLSQAILRGDIATDDAKHVARYVLTYCDSRANVLDSGDADRAALEVTKRIDALVRDLPSESFCAFCGKYQPEKVDADRACPSCARLRRDEQGGSESEGA